MTARPASVSARSRAIGAALLLVVTAAACSTSSSSAAEPSTAATTTSTTSTTIAPTTTTVAPAVASPKPKVPTTGAYFGTWRGPGPGRPTDPRQNITDAEAAIGRKYAIDHQFYGWGAAIPSAYETWTAAHGRIPMVSLCACKFETGTAVKWAAIASGKYDSYLSSIARGFVALKQPAFFVFDSEPERQSGLKGTAADYRAAFRHVVAVFRAKKADSVAFVFATTSYAFLPESGQSALVKSFYPGDNVVDWVAADPYNFDTAGAWHSLSYEMGPWYAWASTLKKPLAFVEWGTKEDATQVNRKAMWFRAALDVLDSRYKDVRAVVYFDERKHERGTINDWRIDTSPTSLSAFAEVAKSPWFRAHA